MTPAHEPRAFSVRARHEHAHHPHLFTETSFEAAALAYVEDHPVAGGEGGEVSIVVTEMASGLQHCFRIDLETGESAPCG